MGRGPNPISGGEMLSSAFSSVNTTLKSVFLSLVVVSGIAKVTDGVLASGPLRPTVQALKYPLQPDDGSRVLLTFEQGNPFAITSEDLSETSNNYPFRRRVYRDDGTYQIMVCDKDVNALILFDQSGFPIGEEILSVFEARTLTHDDVSALDPLAHGYKIISYEELFPAQYDAKPSPNINQDLTAQ